MPASARWSCGVRRVTGCGRATPCASCPRTMGQLCRGPEAVAAAEDAVTILEPLGPSTELAWAYAGLATQRLMDAERHAAIELALRAQAIAEPLGAPEVLSDALNTQGCASACLGREWTGLLRRALEIALSEGLDEQAGRAFTNLYSTYCRAAEIRRGESGTAWTASPTATSTISLPGRPACGLSGPAPWSGPAAGMRRWR